MRRILRQMLADVVENEALHNALLGACMGSGFCFWCLFVSLEPKAGVTCGALLVLLLWVRSANRRVP